MRKPPCFGWLPLRSIVADGSGVGKGDGVGLGVGDGEGDGERVGFGESVGVGVALGVGVVALPLPQAMMRSSRTRVEGHRSDRIAINGNDRDVRGVFGCHGGYRRFATAAYNQAVSRRCSHV
jgi:hypothetical protein